MFISGTPDKRRTDVRSIAIILAVLLGIQFVTLPRAAVAEQVAVNLTRLPGLQGELPVHKLGNLLFAEGVALLQGQEMSILEKTETTNHLEAVLKGRIVKTETVSSNGSTLIKGISYFNDGTKLPSLEPNCKKESVDLKDGSKLIGHISDVSNDALSVGSKTVLMSNVSAIHSGHAFNFNVKISAENQSGSVKGDSTGMNFSPT